MPLSPGEVRARDGDRQGGHGRLSPLSQPWGTVNDNPKYRHMITALPRPSWPYPWGARPCQVPACRWRGRQDSRREGSSQTAVPSLAFTRCVPAVSAPAFSGAASPSRGTRQAEHGPRGSELAFPGSVLAWHCGLARIPWRRQCSPLCRCEPGIHRTGCHSTGRGTAGTGITPTPVTPRPLPLWLGSALRRGKRSAVSRWCQ